MQVVSPTHTRIQHPGALDDLLGPLVANPQGATLEDDLRNGELLFELEPYAERSKILVGEDDDDTLLGMPIFYGYLTHQRTRFFFLLRGRATAGAQQPVVPPG